MRFTFPHSHAFPGGRVAVAEEGGDPAACMVEFSDGVTVIAGYRRIGEDIVLDVPSYRTSKGTLVAARRWRNSKRSDGIWRTARVS